MPNPPLRPANSIQTLQEGRMRLSIKTETVSVPLKGCPAGHLIRKCFRIEIKTLKEESGG